MWVNTESLYDGRPSKMNLGVAMNVDDLGDHFRVYFAGESGFQAVKKTPEMIEAYNSLVPEKSQPVVPAEPTPEEPFRITGFGLYEMRSGEQQRVTMRDPSGLEPMWFCSTKGWYFTDGRWNVNNHANDIVKLIKLDGVQP